MKFTTIIALVGAASAIRVTADPNPTASTTAAATKVAETAKTGDAAINT